MGDRGGGTKPTEHPWDQPKLEAGVWKGHPCPKRPLRPQGRTWTLYPTISRMTGRGRGESRTWPLLPPPLPSVTCKNRDPWAESETERLGTDRHRMERNKNCGLGIRRAVGGRSALDPGPQHTHSTIRAHSAWMPGMDIQTTAQRHDPAQQTQPQHVQTHS